MITLPIKINLFEEMYDEAEEVLRKAISELPSYAELYSSLGVLLGRQNRLEVCVCVCVCVCIVCGSDSLFKLRKDKNC